MATEGGVTLPGVGKVSRKWVMIVAGASVISIGYFLYKRKQAAAAAAAVPAASTDTTGTGQVDPLTGDIAGSAQDQMDLAALQSGGYGSGMYGSGGAGGYYSGYGALGSSGVTPPVPGTGGFTTNGQWAQQAESDLGGIGVSQVALAAALGHYLTGSPLASGEQTMVDQAIAEEGYPPVAGPSGYPPAMHTAPTGSGGGTGTGTVTVPNITGQRLADATGMLTAAGLRIAGASQVKGVSQTVTGQRPAAGAAVAAGSAVTVTTRKS